MLIKKWLIAVLIMGLAVALIGCSDDDNNSSTNGPASGVVELEGTYTTDLNLTADNEYLLKGGVFIGDGVNETVLDIEPGTVIYGESATNAMLVISRESKIIAEGTSDAPIVFTSDQNEGSRARGDWGGIIINGHAPLNVEGGESEGEGDTGTYGGTDPHDNSGILKYVRVEFAGREISPDNELNGIALQAVGDGTEIDYVQVHMNKDDGIEFFGGTINAKHVYITGAADDQFDWTDGWQGKGQFWICQQYEDDADQGIEADNNAENNDATPRSSPTIYNVTLIGAMNDANNESDIGMLLREGTGAVIKNAIVMDFGDCGIDLDHEPTFINATGDEGETLNGNLVVDNCIFYDNNEVYQTGETNDPEQGDHDESFYYFTTQEFIEILNANNRFENPLLTAPYDTGNPDYTPGADSPALSGYATPPADGFFDAVEYIGGIGPEVNWLEGWTISVTD